MAANTWPPRDHRLSLFLCHICAEYLTFFISFYCIWNNSPSPDLTGQQRARAVFQGRSAAVQMEQKLRNILLIAGIFYTTLPTSKPCE